MITTHDAERKHAMKIAAVIAEYNPFHKGHSYQLHTLRNELDADRILVVMSGDFVQRGEPAIVDKYVRCRMALENGADMVLELPVYFALGSAEYFAQGAVSLLDKLGIVDTLYFGSECGDIEALKACARPLLAEPAAYKAQLKQYLKQGYSFPSARSMAFCSLFSGNAASETADYEKILAAPNNNLGIAYIKALLQRNSAITPRTLRRRDSGYASLSLTGGSFASANAVRSALLEKPDSIDSLKEFLPESVWRFFKNSRGLLSADDFSQLLHYKLLAERRKGKDCFASFYDVSRQLSNTLYHRLPDYNGFADYALACKSKNLTYTRISRCLMHILLDMTQETACALKEHDYCPYARVLGFREGGRDIFRLMKTNSAVPIITRPASARKQLNSLAQETFLADRNASDIYQSVLSHKTTRVSYSDKPHPIPNELTRPILKD